MHYSTDYVFDGSKAGLYRETDPPDPLNLYGRSKLLGEQAILQSACDHLIFRVSCVCGLYHLTAQGETSWRGFAQVLFDCCRALQKPAPEMLIPISTQEYSAPAMRPLNSRLCTDKLCQTFKITLPNWLWHVERIFFHGSS